MERRVRDGRRTQLGIPRGTIKATVLIETILAAFEMDEILYELREHSAGLNCGRWDYIFSFIKKFRNDPTSCLADRAQVTMTTPLPALLLPAAASRPATAAAPTRWAAWRRRSRSRTIRRPTTRRWRRCAPTRSARRATATTAPGWRIPAWCRSRKEVFDRLMPAPNQIAPEARGRARDRRRPARRSRPSSPITESGLRAQHQRRRSSTSRPGCAGTGCVPIYNLMEDAATAEISRAQVWQWIRSPKGVLDDGRKVTQGDGRRDDRRGAGEDPRAPRPGVRRRYASRRPRSCSPTWSTPTVHRVPDAAGLRANRLSEAREARAERRTSAARGGRRQGPHAASPRADGARLMQCATDERDRSRGRRSARRRAMEDGRRPMVAALQQRCKEAD